MTPNYYEEGMRTNNVVGNNYYADDAAGFKSEVKTAFESYQSEGVNLTSDMLSVLNSPENRTNFIGSLCESLTDSALFTSGTCANQPFYNNYADRVEQLLDNSMLAVARESAMLGYAPIVAYNPFFLKKQWIECIFKDVLMTEVPKSPIINLAFEKRYVKTQSGKKYELPAAYYDEEIVKELLQESQGIPIIDTPIELSTLTPGTSILNPTYFPGMVTGDPAAQLTADLTISKVYLEDSAATEHEVPCNIRTDITTHNWLKGKVKYDVKDTSGAVTETIEDEIVGNVDFEAGTVTIISTKGKIKKICFKGKLANRFNNRSLDVERKVEQMQFTMPESGPRLNSEVTVEDAADALVLQNIDVIADKVDQMGKSLANLEDMEIKMFLDDSFAAQKAAGVGPHGYESMIVEGGFDAKPFDTYTHNLAAYLDDCKLYFERVIQDMGNKLNTPHATIVAITHPDNVSFLQGKINWVFSDNTQISGMKLAYDFGVYTTSQTSVHVITTRKMPNTAGIKFVLIPLTNELISFKHYKYSTVIDRGYRNPVYTLVPNIMCTHRSLTFEVLPVQGHLDIKGRDMYSPATLTRTP